MANLVNAQSVGRMAAITPNDAARFAPTIGISVNGTGLVSMLPAHNTGPVAFHALAGVIYPVRAVGVFATGTAATGIVAHYQE